MTTAFSGGKAGATKGKNGPKSGSRNKLMGTESRCDFTPAGPDLTFVRPDWTEFRDLSRISNKAGVPLARLPRCVAKELVDNGLDAGAEVTFGPLACAPNEFAFYVADSGPGINGSDEELARRFSIARPLTSSKALRRPGRGMLGNGTRVVAGAVLCSAGTLKVSTRGRTLALAPQDDGSTAVVSVEPWSGTGTRIEVALRGELARHARADTDVLRWAEEARSLAGLGSEYKGHSSVWWYDAAAFFEMLRAAGPGPVEQVVAKLDGCTARGKAPDLAADLLGVPAAQVTREQAAALMARVRAVTAPVTVQRVGKVGRRDDYFGYAIESVEIEYSAAMTVPVVVEVWANRSTRPCVAVCVNRTPIVTEMHLRRDEGSDYAIFGAGLRHRFKAGRKSSGEYALLINLTAPFVPLTSTGKDPDLHPVHQQILAACEKAVRAAKGKAPNGTRAASQKDLIQLHLAATCQTLSGNGTCLFSLRQLFYAIRPHLITAIGREPSYGTFCRVVGDFEDECGDIDNLYRDDRGSLYHPHTGEVIPLGTRSVAEYQRPKWAFNKVLYSEKEGFFPLLQQARWPERYDCALLTSKGYATRAVLALLKLLVGTGEPVSVYLIHDADGPGTVIYESLQRLAKRHQIKIINLGLEPEEAREMGLQNERVERKTGSVPVGKYVPKGDKEWLQSNRIELNAMTTPQFLGWLTSKMSAHGTGKVIPPADVVTERLVSEARTATRDRITAEILKAAGLDHRVEAAMRRLDVATASAGLYGSMKTSLDAEPAKHWSDLVSDAARKWAAD